MADMNGSNGFTSVNSAPSVVAATSQPPAAAAGTKRKRESALKFYSVRVGKQPGIYHTWAECLDQVRGYPKAIFKSFTSLTEAQSFLDGESAAGDGVGKGQQKWYAVQKGRVPGVYASWPEVLDQITGWKGPKHKAFKTRTEAELFVKEGQNEALESIEAVDAIPALKKSKASGKKGMIKDENASPGPFDHDGGEYPAGEAPLPDGTEDGFDPTITLDHATNGLRYKTSEERQRMKYQAVRPAPNAPVRIYTDGSSLANGQAHAIGGVGVYFGPGDKRNISEGLTGTKQTNQRAELTAILRALEVAPRDRKIIIFSDSNYAIKCTNEWFQKWRENGWVNASRKPVENRDLIQKIIDVLEERYRMNQHRVYDEEDDSVDYDEPQRKKGHWERGPAGVRFQWVKGHDKDEGNNAADSLATAGAREARELVDGDVDLT